MQQAPCYGDNGFDVVNVIVAVCNAIADTVEIADFLCAWVPSFRTPRLNSPAL